MNVLDQAILFAMKAHEGMTRKGSGSPYILHPLETAAIAGTMTDDPEILAAAALHDTVEDTPVTIEEIRAAFGERVAALVASETEDKRADRPPEETWQIRKAESLALLRAAGPDTKILWLSDKLSNMRSFYRLWQKEGDALWNRFHQSDPARQAWYYRTVAECTKEFSDTAAWREFTALADQIFEGVKENG